MRRLAFSSEAFKRRLGMARSARLFLVMEGKSVDPWYYEELCQRDPVISASGVMLYRAQALGREIGERGLPGGKTGVLAIYDRLRDLGALHVKTKAGQRSVMFCLDADHDRILNRTRRSKHVTYTQLPDIEAQLLDSVDQSRLIAMTMSCTKSDAAVAHAHFGDWRLQYANLIRDWVVACHLGKELGIVGAPNPDTPPSLKVSGASVRVDLKALNGINLGIANKAASKRALSEAQVKVIDRIDSLFRSSRHLALLKGKWLASYLAVLLGEYSRTQELDNPGGAAAILNCAKGIATFDGAWPRYWQNRARRLLEVESD